MQRLMTAFLVLLTLLAGQAHAQTCNSAIPASTPTSRFVINGDGTVTDSDTGLMWKQCSEGQTTDGAGGCTGTAGAYTWQQALQQAQTLNAGGGYAGQGDWRVPNIKELGSIVERQCYSPAINETVFPGTPSSGFWSASPSAYYSDSAWGVYFGYGDDYYAFKSADRDVRLVRGGQSFDIGPPVTPITPVPVKVTNAAGLYVRQGPGTANSSFTEISFGQEFVAFQKSEQGGDVWYKIHLPCGNGKPCTGWVAGIYQGVTYSVQEPAATQVEVTGTGPIGLRILAYPNGSVIDSAWDGQRFVTLGTQPSGSGCYSNWYEIYLPLISGASTGWGCGDWVQVSTASGSGTADIQGRVATAGSSSLPAVSMALGGAASATTSTLADGTYTFTGLNSGAYTLTPSFSGYTFEPPSRPNVNVSGSNLSGLDFRACQTNAPLTGILRDELTRAPIAGATVTAGGVSAVTDATGTYSIPGLDCGDYDVTVNVSGFRTYLKKISTFDGRSLDVGLTVESTVKGANTESGNGGDPVNTATGNYYYVHSDLALPGKGMGFEFVRTYNSRDPLNGPLGFGWNHNYQSSLAIDSGVVTIRWGDGKTETWGPDGAGGFTPQYGVFDYLTDDGSGGFILRKKNLTEYRFNAPGQLTSVTDKNGNATALAYTAGNLTQVTDTAGRTINFAYDTGNRITDITGPLGRVTQFNYDANGDLISATDPNGNVTVFTYNTNHQMLTVVDPLGNTIVSSTYDASRRVVIYQTDAKGGATTYTYDEPSRTTTFTNALGFVTTHVHDDLMRLIRAKDGRGGIVLYEYDDRGNRIKVTDKNGNITQYGYDASGNVTSKTDTLSNVTAITYDANNNPLTRTDALSNTTSFTYDANGNLLTTTDALTNTTTVTYDASGLPLTITDARGNTTTNTYDVQGNLTRVQDALGNLTQYTYDGVGRRLTRADALGRTTTYAYDNNNNLRSVTDPAG
ncbi:MAG TPA: DUF1566 domain-containing protein, partial [Gammaproteobacteria bacterium]|nr:DUF1566 domain-containing protein [Gammaproteobacteria bacterium]